MQNKKKNQKKKEKWDYLKKNLKNHFQWIKYFFSVFKTLNKGQEGFRDKS